MRPSTLRAVLLACDGQPRTISAIALRAGVHRQSAAQALRVLHVRGVIHRIRGGWCRQAADGYVGGGVSCPLSLAGLLSAMRSAVKASRNGQLQVLSRVNDGTVTVLRLFQDGKEVTWK